jgi:hemerythrin
LTSWLGLHILGIDQEMSRQILRMRQGQSAKQAFEQEDAVAQDSSAQALLRMVSKLYRMLSEQNSELARANAHLEDRVLQRTLELERANTALKSANQQLEVFSRTDGLLKIANRQYFDERLGEECARAHRSGSPLGLLMIDVDFFKPYNDRYGHQEGDRCLQAVAQTVASVLLRSSDLVARYGGEELGVILPATDAAGTLATAQRVCNAVYALELPHADSSAAPYVTVSVGACTRLPRGRDADADLLALADRALYQAKGAGRNRVVVMQVPS